MSCLEHTRLQRGRHTLTRDATLAPLVLRSPKDALTWSLSVLFSRSQQLTTFLPLLPTITSVPFNLLKNFLLFFLYPRPIPPPRSSLVNPRPRLVYKRKCLWTWFTCEPRLARIIDNERLVELHCFVPAFCPHLQRP